MQVRKFIQAANYPVVSSNIVDAQGRLFAPKPYVILKVNGLRVAVLGAMTDILATLSTPKLLEQWHTMPVVDTVRKYAAELRAQSDLVVLLAHITGEEENRSSSPCPKSPCSSPATSIAASTRPCRRMAA